MTTTTLDDTIDRERIAFTDRLIRPHIRRTPVIEIDAVNLGHGTTPASLKLELLQHSGSFKVRGAFANLLGRTVPAAGVIAASGGNHGAAVAYAAQRLGVHATIFVPSISSPAKMERIRDYGAELVVAGERYADALAASEEWVARTGALPVHAFDQPETLLGQGTVALELEEQAPELDTVLVAVGGGGLIGGIAAWYAETAARIVGVEPIGCPTLHAARGSGGPVDVPSEGIARDSLGARRIGVIAWEHSAAGHIADSLLVDDDAIADARRWLWQEARLAVEPGTPAAMAAVRAGVYKPEPDETVVVVICGANADPADL